MGKKKEEQNQFSTEISADLKLDVISCRGPCKKQFPRNTFLKHIFRAKSRCKHLYKAEELNQMKKASKQINQKRQHRKKNAMYQSTKEERLKASTQKTNIY